MKGYCRLDNCYRREPCPDHIRFICEFEYFEQKEDSMNLTIQQLFSMGMKRHLGHLRQPSGTVLNLGAGNSLIAGTLALDLPYWDAMSEDIPYDSESVDGIYAFHFLEHLSSERAIYILRECQRVLKVGGLLTIVVPHMRGEMAFQDLDHRSFYTLETWRTLFKNPYYVKNREEPWNLSVHFNMIAAVAERNLAILTQMEKI